MTRAQLALRKMQGCLIAFGIRETARRVVREAARALAGSARPDLDVAEVHPRLLVGAAPRSTTALHRLAAAGVTDAIDLRAERRASDLLARTEALRVHWVPTFDDWRPKERAFYERVAQAARDVWTASPDARLLVCCAAGEHRGPLGGALVLAGLVGDLDEALRRVREARAVAEFLPMYAVSLREYWSSREAA